MRLTASIIYFLFTCLFITSCTGISDDVVPAQRERIERYLQNSNLEFTNQNGVYVHIGNAGRTGYNNATQIAAGDSVYFYFAEYEFTTSRLEPAFYSNRDWIIDELRDQGLSAVYWSRDIYKAKLGKTPLLKGVERGLPGCREGDSVRMFLTANMAYGENYISTLPLNSSVEWVIWIEEVKKQ